MVVKPCAVIGKIVNVVPVTVPVQLSVVVGAVGLALHCAFIVANTGDNGAVMSIFVTLNVHILVFPFMSVTVKVITSVPVPLTVLPIIGDCVTDAIPQLSLAVASGV